MSDRVESCGKREILSSKNAKNSLHPAFFALDSVLFFRYNRYIQGKYAGIAASEQGKPCRPSFVGAGLRCLLLLFPQIFCFAKSLREPCFWRQLPKLIPCGGERQPPSARSEAELCEGTPSSPQSHQVRRCVPRGLIARLASPLPTNLLLTQNLCGNPVY